MKSQARSLSLLTVSAPRTCMARPERARRRQWAARLLSITLGLLGVGVPAAQAQAPLASYGLTPGWATFGLPLPQGAATTGVKIGSLATQVDVTSRWPDGSIKFAIVTVKAPAAADYPITANVPPATGSFVPVWPLAAVTMTLRPANVTYTATLPAFSAADSWLSGPLARESRVRVTPVDGIGAPHPFLRVLFDVRSFNDGTHRIDVIGENTLVQSATTDRVDYDLDIRLNGASVYTRAASTPGAGTISTTTGSDIFSTSLANDVTKGDLIEVTSGPQTGELRMIANVYNSTINFLSWPFSTPQKGVTWAKRFRHWAGSRWRRTLSVGGYQESLQTPDFTTFFSSHAVPPFLSTVPVDTSYPGLGTHPYEPMNVGIPLVPGNSAGGRPEIGPYPQWIARYLAHATPALRAIVLGEGSSAGTFPIHWSTTDAKPLISLDDYPTFWRTWGNGGRGMGKSDDGMVDHYQMDSPHVASLAFVPYLLTGDRYYLDEMRYIANFSMLSTYTQGLPASSKSRGDGAGYLGQQFNGGRGWGWALRNLVDVAAWSPDADQYKTYFNTRVLTNLSVADVYAAGRTELPWEGFVDSSDGFAPRWPEDNSYPSHAVTALWQVCYLGWAVDHAIQLGYPGGTGIRSKIARLIMNIYSSPGVQPAERAPYRLFLGSISAPGEPILWYPTLDQAYAAMRLDAYAYTALMPAALGAYYGTDVRLIYQIANRLGMVGAAAALNWIESYVDQNGTPFMTDLKARSQFAIASAPPAGTRPSSPTNVRIVR